MKPVVLNNNVLYIYGDTRHTTRFVVNIKCRGHIYRQIMHKKRKTNK